MKFSLIIGTLNRLQALKGCLQSINRQTYQDFEIIIIDQSDDLETQNYIVNLDDKRIIYKHVDFKGLSKARNVALNLAKGDYFCLIDDDANYTKEYLELANNNICPNTILSGYIYDTVKKDKFVNYKEKYDKKKLPISRVFKTCPSASLVIPMSVIKRAGNFDELFGVGGQYGAGEETDLLLRALKKGYIIKYVQDMKLKHPVPARTELVDPSKMCKYYEGIGALFKKHIGHKYIWFSYVEIKLKFFIKKVVFRGEKRRWSIDQELAFKKGYRTYLQNNSFVK